MGSITGQGSMTHRDLNSQNGLPSTSRISSNGSALKRGSGRKVGNDRAISHREDRNAVAFTSRSSTKPVARASSRSNISKSGSPSRLAPDTTQGHGCRLLKKDIWKLHHLLCLLLRKVNLAGCWKQKSMSLACRTGLSVHMIHLQENCPYLCCKGWFLPLQMTWALQSPNVATTLVCQHP